MRKVALLHNPDSGGSRKRRNAEMDAVVALLREAGVEATLVLTHSREHAGEKARQAVLAGCDTVFACGGDGTIHNIIQVLANTQVALAVLPMGTANALAHDLNLPMNITAAAKAALTAGTRRVALGQIDYRDFEGKTSARYFILTAGMGVDAHLFYQLAPETKRRLGMAAYYAKAWHLWFTYAMPRFQIDYVASDSQLSQRAQVTEMLGVRIRNFGGVLQHLAPGASLDRDDIRLILCRTASRAAYLLYVARALLRLNFPVPGIDLVHAGKAVCGYIGGNDSANADEKIYVEADGELLGTLPAEITVIPNALTILGPLSRVVSATK